MEECEERYVLNMLWGERGTGYRTHVRVEITRIQFDAFCDRTAYQELLLFECNNVICEEQRIPDFREYETECVVEDSPEALVITNLLSYPSYRSKVQTVDLTAPEFQP